MNNLKVICRFSIPKCYRLCLVNIHSPTRHGTIIMMKKFYIDAIKVSNI